MFIVVSADGTVLANMTSGVDAHCIQNATPGSRTYLCHANSSTVKLVSGQEVVRSTDNNVCQFVTVKKDQACSTFSSPTDPPLPK